MNIRDRFQIRIEIEHRVTGHFITQTVIDQIDHRPRAGGILEGILGELGGGDPLASLQALLSSGGLGGLLEGLLDLLGDILGGLLGGLGAPAA